MSFLSIPLFLQIFCIYHAYKNHKETHWYFIIFFLPLIGGIIYLFTQVLNKRDLEKTQDSVINIVNPTKKINDLKKQLEFTDTHENKINLADAYFNIEDYLNAIKLYEDALKGLFKKDEYVLRKLVIAYYQINNYDLAVEKGTLIKDNNDFKKSNGYYYLALAFAKTGKTESAKEIFNFINKPFSNYEERLNYANYLIRNNNTTEGKDLLSDLIHESSRVSKEVKRKNSFIFKEANKTFNSL